MGCLERGKAHVAECMVSLLLEHVLVVAVTKIVIDRNL